MNSTRLSLSALVAVVLLVGCRKETASVGASQRASDNPETRAVREQGRLGQQLFEKASLVVSVCGDEGDDTVMIGPTYDRTARATAGLNLSQLESVAAAATNYTLAVVIMPAMCFNKAAVTNTASTLKAAGFTTVQVLVERWGVRFPWVE